jgi:hypothetical protein
MPEIEYEDFVEQFFDHNEPTPDQSEALLTLLFAARKVDQVLRARRSGRTAVLDSFVRFLIDSDEDLREKYGR